MKRKGKIMVFKDREELKWHYHEKLCHGDSSAQYYMEHVLTEKDVNLWLQRVGELCRVKEV